MTDLRMCWWCGKDGTRWAEDLECAAHAGSLVCENCGMCQKTATEAHRGKKAREVAETGR